MSYTVRLRTRVFLVAARGAGYRTHAAMADAMGVNRSTVTRVVDGALQPGSAFIAGALTVLAPLRFEDLFELRRTARRKRA